MCGRRRRVTEEITKWIDPICTPHADGAERLAAERRQCALRPDEDRSRSVAYGEPTPGTEPITGDCSVPAAVPTWRTEIAGSGRGSGGWSAVAALFSSIRCPFLVVAKITCPHSPRSSEPASEANRFAQRAGRSGCRRLPGDQDEGTERDTGQQVQCGCGYAHAAVADRMAEC